MGANLVPFVDIARYMREGRSAGDECERLRVAFERTGLVRARPRAYSQTARIGREARRVFRDVAMLPDAQQARLMRPDIGHQLGLTPNRQEWARDVSGVTREFTAAIPPELQPLMGSPGDPNNNRRWFHRFGPAPEETAFPGLNEANVDPGVPGFMDIADEFGFHMLEAVTDALGMLEVAYGLPEGELRELCTVAPHLVAPTFIDLTTCAAQGIWVPIRAHEDCNLITSHLAASHKALVAYMRDGTPVWVVVNESEGEILLQAGMQLSILTGFRVLPGIHQVMIPSDQRAALAHASRNGEVEMRVGGTMFGHTNSDARMTPLAPFRGEPGADLCPDWKAGHQIQHELLQIGLMDPASASDADLAAAYVSRDGQSLLQLPY